MNLQQSPTNTTRETIQEEVTRELNSFSDYEEQPIPQTTGPTLCEYEYDDTIVIIESINGQPLKKQLTITSDDDARVAIVPLKKAVLYFVNHVITRHTTANTISWHRCKIAWQNTVIDTVPEEWQDIMITEMPPETYGF